MEEEEAQRKALKVSKSKSAVAPAVDSRSDGQQASSTAVGRVFHDATLGLTLPPTPQMSRVFESQCSMGGAKATIPFDIDMYITVCMGNIYQSSGDDEQALVQYQKGWAKAKAHDEFDWATVCLNSIGLVAYYNLRYELGYQCFLTVADYRVKVREWVESCLHLWFINLAE